MFKSAFVLAMVLGAAPFAAADAHEYQAGSLKIGHPWSLPTAPGAPTAAGYLTITNTGTKPDRLLSAETPDAAKVEMHHMTMNGGIMRMREAIGGVVLAPGQTVKFEPGGDHLMLIGPKHPLKVGDHIPLTLHFGSSKTLEVELFVQSRSPVMDDTMKMEMK